MLIYWNIISLLLGAGSRNASARNYHFGRSNFHLQLSLLRVSARRPRALCVTEFVRGFAAASLSWRQCTAAYANMTASCGHQTTTSGDIFVPPRRGACHWNVLPVEEFPAWIICRKKALNAIIPITCTSHELLPPDSSFSARNYPPPPPAPLSHYIPF